MSLLVTVNEGLSFDRVDEKVWNCAGFDGERCWWLMQKNSVPLDGRPAPFGSDLNTRWNVTINYRLQSIICDIGERTCKILPLRPGVIVLDELTDIESVLHARVRTFRKLNFQAFLDKYGISATRFYHHGITPQKLQRQHGDETIRVTALYSDGKTKVDESKNRCSTKGATWALYEFTTMQTATDEVKRVKRLLFRRKRYSVSRLEELFEQYGVKPVTTNDNENEN